MNALFTELTFNYFLTFFLLFRVFVRMAFTSYEVRLWTKCSTRRFVVRLVVSSFRSVTSTCRSVTSTRRFVERLVVSSFRSVTPLVVSSLRCCVSSFRFAVDHCARLETRKSTIRVQMIWRGRLLAKMADRVESRAEYLTKTPRMLLSLATCTCSAQFINIRHKNLHI